MKDFDWSGLSDKVMTLGIDYGKRLLAAILIYIIGSLIIRWIIKLMKKGTDRKSYDPAIKGFVLSMVNITLKVLLIVAIISTLGVETTSISAIIAAAGLSIGLALSGSLQNFAGGVLILIMRPYRIGDFIETNGQMGVVDSIQLFNTIITTVDNKVVIIPNASISNAIITNYSEKDIRRVDFTIGVDYGTEYEKVEKVIQKMVAEETRVLKDPEHFMGLGKLNDSSIDFTLRLWVKSTDYWGVYFDMTRKIYAEFNKEGIEFPFPQMTVHQAKD